MKSRLENDEWVALFDNAARGNLDAQVELAESYMLGTYGQTDYKKALKWCSYAARHGSLKAAMLLPEISKRLEM